MNLACMHKVKNNCFYPAGFLQRPRRAERDRVVRGADAGVGGGHACGGARHLQDGGTQNHGGPLHEARR